jgi:hypothetical protein
MKSTLFLASMGVSYIYELRVLLKRFADIYTMDNVVMRRIDETTKQPVPIEKLKKISPASNPNKIYPEGSMSFESINVFKGLNEVNGKQ